MKITNFEGIKLFLLTEKEKKSYYKEKLCYMCKNKFNSDIKRHWKVRDHDQGFYTSYIKSKITKF